MSVILLFSRWEFDATPQPAVCWNRPAGPRHPSEVLPTGAELVRDYHLG